MKNYSREIVDTSDYILLINDPGHSFKRYQLFESDVNYAILETDSKEVIRMNLTLRGLEMTVYYRSTYCNFTMIVGYNYT